MVSSVASLVMLHCRPVLSLPTELAGLAHDGDELAGVDGQVDTVQNFQLVRLADVVALADALHLDQGLRGMRGLLPYQAPGNILRKLLCFFRHY